MSEGIPQPSAVYRNATEFLLHLHQSQFPAQALAVALSRDHGNGTVEIGIVVFGKRDAATDERIYPELTLVRLTIPRRVFTKQHLASVGETLIDRYHRQDSIGGRVMTNESPGLRHCPDRFEEETPAGILWTGAGFAAVLWSCRGRAKWKIRRPSSLLQRLHTITPSAWSGHPHN